VRRADHADFLVLQDAQKLDLHGYTCFTNLVEKNGAAIRRLKKTGARFVGARESAFDVAKKFAFQELLGDGAAIDGNKGR